MAFFMQIQRFEVGPFAQNTYLLWDDSRHSVLIDAGFSNDREFDMLFEFLEKHHLDIDLDIGRYLGDYAWTVSGKVQKEQTLSSIYLLRSR